MDSKRIIVFSFLFICASNANLFAESDMINKGIKSCNYGKYQRAKEILHEEYLKDNKDRKLFISLGIAFINCSDWEDAKTVLDEGSKYYPNDPHINIMLARIYERTGEDKKALKYWNKILSLNVSSKKKATAKRHIKRIESRK